MEFGIFDHLDRNDLPLAEFYEGRLKLVEAYDRGGFHRFQLKGERCKFGDELALDFRDIFDTASVGEHGPDDHLVSFEGSRALIQRINAQNAADRPCSGLVPAFLLGCI